MEGPTSSLGFSLLLWCTLFALVGIVLYEQWGTKLREGFETIVTDLGQLKQYRRDEFGNYYDKNGEKIQVKLIPFEEGIAEGVDEVEKRSITSIWTKWAPRRGDVGPELEIKGLKRSPLYFSGYVDMQRFGVKNDFCRMVQEGDDDRDMFFACALANTENLSSVSYRTPSVREGFRLSRDDYMADTNGDGRSDYCRILKQDDGSWEAVCNLAADTKFLTDEQVDSDPPPNIQTLLNFYQNSMIWLRLDDDMIDYCNNLVLGASGGLSVVEIPSRPKVTKGLVFNGTNQYLRVGDTRKYTFGNKVLLRSARALEFMVRFDEFTNNAHIFDFGNGAGVDNVFLGIEGRGNLGISDKPYKPICGDTSTLPASPSGPQPEWEISPQKLMETTCANVNDYDCKGMAVKPEVPPRPTPNQEGITTETASLIYEVWEGKQRKMRIKVPGFFTKGEWTHVAITASDLKSFRPDIVVYRNGEQVFVEPNGWLPAVGNTKRNYLGKSNWADATSQYANKDELFKGALFDFRVYSNILTKDGIREAMQWAQGRLGLEIKKVLHTEKIKPTFQESDVQSEVYDLVY